MRKIFSGVALVILHACLFDAVAQPMRVGVAQGSSIINDASTMNKIVGGIVGTGAGYTRIDLDWRWIQPEGPATYDWTVAEPAFDVAISAGLKVIALPTYSPEWANGNTGKMQSPPTNDTYFYNFCYQAALRYIPKGVLDWELWNEANGGGMSVSEYVNRVLKPGHNALRDAANALGIDPNSINVITSGPQPAASDSGKIYSQVDWVRGIYNNGGKNYFNSVGQHPYCWPFDPATESQWNWFKKTPELYKVMENNQDANKKIWVTEMGWPTHTAVDGDDRGITETEQALFLQKAYNMWNSWPWSGPFLIYNYWPEYDHPGDPEQNFGMVRTNFSAKPSLQAVKDMFSGKVWAEAGTLSGSAAVSTSGSGWSGAGYVRNLNASLRNAVTVNIYAPSAGTYNIAFRYSNGNSGTRTLSVYINGIDTRNVSFSRTGNWDTSWRTVTQTFTLREGINAIKLQYDNGDGRIDIDYVMASKANATVTQAYNESIIDTDAKKIINCYPNTFSETAKLEINVSANDKYLISITNSSNHAKAVLLEKTLPIGTHYFTFGDDLKPGIYFVELRSSTVNQTIRVIKN